MDSSRTIGGWLVTALFVCSSSVSAEPATLALTNATVYTDPINPPIPIGHVITRGPEILAVGARESVDVPANATVIDCAGKTITAGFWNSHVHFLQRKWANAGDAPSDFLTKQLGTMVLHYGFTTVVDAWSNHENTSALRARINAGDVNGPRILTAGPPIYGAGDSPSTVAVIWEALGFFSLNAIGIDRVATPEDVRAAVASRLENGVEFVKLYAQSPGRGDFRISQALLKAAVERAEQVPVLVHPSVESALVDAVLAGADVIMHTTPQSGPWHANTVALMKAHDAALVPTLSLWPYELRHERADILERYSNDAVSQLQAWVEADGDVLFGTDAGYMADYDPALEYALMSEANMTPEQILASLTTNPASRLGGPDERGTIEVGQRADLTVLDRTIDQIGAFKDVHMVIREGTIIYTREN